MRLLFLALGSSDHVSGKSRVAGDAGLFRAAPGRPVGGVNRRRRQGAAGRDQQQRETAFHGINSRRVELGSFR